MHECSDWHEGIALCTCVRASIQLCDMRVCHVCKQPVPGDNVDTALEAVGEGAQPAATSQNLRLHHNIRLACT